MKVRDVMTSALVTASPETPFADLVHALVSNDIGAVPVVDSDGKLVGIVTEADLVSKAAYGGHHRKALEVLADLVAGGQTRWAIKGKGITARQLMTTDVSTARPEQNLRAVARLMVEEGRKRIPIVEEGRVVGIVSRSDVLRALHRSDEQLSDDVVALLADPLRSPDDHAVTASVAEGVVTLGGTVRYPMDLSLVRAMIWDLPGVVDVVVEATAREPDPRVGVG